MKVLMYGWELPPHISGGLGVACQGIVQGLLNNSCEITFILPSKTPIDENLFQNSEHLNIIHADFFKEKLNSYFSLYRKQLNSYIKEYAKFAAKFAKDVPHDVIHVHDWLTVLAGIEAKKISHKPLFFHIHSLEVERSEKSHNKAIYDIEKFGLDHADRIIAVSEFTKNNIIREYNIFPSKISVVHNGIFPDQIKEFKLNEVEQPAKKTVLFLGRMTGQKAPFQFIDAAAKLLKKRKDVQFIMAGDGDLFKKCIDRVAKLKLGSYFHFTRFLNRDEVNSIYSKSQVYVMPSLAEPFGLTCLEAICHHVPVICSKQSGVSEVIQNMIKVDSWDIEEIVDKIDELLDSPKLRTELIKNSIEELHNLLWDESGKKILNLYNQFTGK